MRSDSGPVRILTPRAPHAVLAELRTHELSIEEIEVPALQTVRPPLQRIESIPAFLLVKRPRRRRAN